MERIVKVSAMADRLLRDAENPFNPINRRVEIVVMTQESEALLTNIAVSETEVDPDFGADAEAANKELVVFDRDDVDNVRRLAGDNQMPDRS